MGFSAEHRLRRVLVTGGAGFVGANLAVALARRHPDWELRRRDEEEQRHGREVRPDDHQPVGPVRLQPDGGEQGLVERRWMSTRCSLWGSR